MLAQDPRPAYKQGKIDDNIYAMNLYDLNIQGQLTASNTVLAFNITQVTK